MFDLIAAINTKIYSFADFFEKGFVSKHSEAKKKKWPNILRCYLNCYFQPLSYLFTIIISTFVIVVIILIVKHLTCFTDVIFIISQYHSALSIAHVKQQSNHIQWKENSKLFVFKLNQLDNLTLFLDFLNHSCKRVNCCCLIFVYNFISSN